jgi:hypothetical protein
MLMFYTPAQSPRSGEHDLHQQPRLYLSRGSPTCLTPLSGRDLIDGSRSEVATLRRRLWALHIHMLIY